MENKARELGLDALLVLSTQAFTYFQSKGGFAEGSLEDLPPARREKYESQRTELKNPGQKNQDGRSVICE